MEEIVTGTYLEYKKTLDAELTKTAESFVKIGYLLKVARDTEVLKESGYATVAEFAKSEYGLSKDIVSRYIHINDRFSENGYGETLDAKYKGFGYSKLAEMLTLPDNIADALDPKMTREQIQEVKKEVKEEQKVTDLEVLMEEKRPEQIELKTDLERFIHQYGHDNKKNFKALSAAEADKENYIEKILDVLAPTGVNTVFVRIAGRGKIMLSIKGKEEKPELLDTRANTTVSYTWGEVADAIGYVYKDGTKEAWESLYGEPFEKEEKKAEESKEKEPGKQQSIKQPEQEAKKAEVQKQLNSEGILEEHSSESVTKELENVIKKPESQGQDKEDEQIPGQKTVEDYPEMKPEKPKAPENDYTSIALRRLPGQEVYYIDAEVKHGTVTCITIDESLVPQIQVLGDDGQHQVFDQAEQWGTLIFKSQEAAEKALVKEE